jgi:glutathione S-transferase
MKFYWCPRTRASRILWLLEELGRPYERVTIDIRDADSRANPGFLEASPLGKVPALADGDVKIADSAAIALYLADRYAPGRLAPVPEDPDRGRFLFWMFFAPGTIEPAMAEKAGGWPTNPQAHGWGDFSGMLRVWEAGIGDGPWVLGESFTVADVMLGSSAVFLRTFGMLPPSPVLEDYADRCLARPAYQTAMAAEEARA